MDNEWYITKKGSIKHYRDHCGIIKDLQSDSGPGGTGSGTGTSAGFF
jgi:hypothetical protein